MSKDADPTRLERPEQHSAMPAEQLGKRAAAFQRALCRKGMPDRYGDGKPKKITAAPLDADG